MRLRIDLPLPSKNNTHEIFFNPTFWSAIKDTAYSLRQWVKGPLYWISSPKVVKDTENAIAYIAKQSIPEIGKPKFQLDIWVSDVLDADNAAKIVQDGIQATGRLNDKQIYILRVFKERRPNKYFDFDLTVIPEASDESEESEKSNPRG